MYKISTCAVCVNSKHLISKFDNSKIAAATLVSFAAAQAGITQCSLPPQPRPRAWHDSSWEAYQDSHSDHVVGCYSLLVDSQSMVGWQITNTFLVEITADTSVDCHSINQLTLDQYSDCYAD